MPLQLSLSANLNYPSEGKFEKKVGGGQHGHKGCHHPQSPS